MSDRHIRPIFLFAGMVLAAAFPGMAQTTVNSPITIPLYFTPTNTGADKLGIWVGIGNGATPQLFEFDTGGTGFYAAYSSLPGVSPWWGGGVTANASQQINISYDSGLNYFGNVAQGVVSIFSAGNAATPSVVTAPTTQIGQMNHIEKINPSNGNVTQLWSNAGNATASPPINGAFYGDFGMNLVYNTANFSSGISNIIGQLNFGAGITPGFRIHADFANKSAHLKIGLTAEDTASPTAKYFKMNADSQAPEGATMPVSGLDYFSQQLFNADISIQKPGHPPLVSAGVGMTPDTGASTTLHNTQLSPGNLPNEYADIIDWTNQQENLGRLDNNLRFILTGTTTSNETVGIWDFTTSNAVNAGNVMVQNNRPNNTTYYLNTGISFFYEYDLIYNMRDGVIGLDVIPEPSAAALLLLAATGFVVHRFFRMKRSE